MTEIKPKWNVPEQAERDLKAAHAEICKLQNLDPAKHDWPEWSSPANTIRWFAKIKADIQTPGGVYNMMLARLETLMGSKPGTAEATELDALSDALVAYEAKMYPGFTTLEGKNNT